MMAPQLILPFSSMIWLMSVIVELYAEVPSLPIAFTMPCAAVPRPGDSAFNWFTTPCSAAEPALATALVAFVNALIP